MTLRSMKTSAVLLATVAITLTASAQTASPIMHLPKARQEKILSVFRTSLKSEFPGIVEGTIYNIVVFKKYYPELNYSPLVNQLNENAQENEDAALRYKAHLAAMYLDPATGIDVKPVSRPADHEYIFRQIAEQLEKKFLVSN